MILANKRSIELIKASNEVAEDGTLSIEFRRKEFCKYGLMAQKWREVAIMEQRNFVDAIKLVNKLSGMTENESLVAVKEDLADLQEAIKTHNKYANVYAGCTETLK